MTTTSCAAAAGILLLTACAGGPSRSTAAPTPVASPTSATPAPSAGPVDTGAELAAGLAAQIAEYGRARRITCRDLPRAANADTTCEVVFAAGPARTLRLAHPPNPELLSLTFEPPLFWIGETQRNLMRQFAPLGATYAECPENQPADQTLVCHVPVRGGSIAVTAVSETSAQIDMLDPETPPTVVRTLVPGMATDATLLCEAHTDPTAQRPVWSICVDPKRADGGYVVYLDRGGRLGVADITLPKSAGAASQRGSSATPDSGGH